MLVAIEVVMRVGWVCIASLFVVMGAVAPVCRTASLAMICACAVARAVSALLKVSGVAAMTIVAASCVVMG